MNATYAVIPGLRQAELRTETLDPSELAPGQLLVRAETTIMSGGTELAAFTALSKSVYKPDGWNRYPWRPGYGLVGHVEAVGPGRTRDLAVGDRVFCFGKHASRQIYDMDSPKPFHAAFRIDDRLAPEVAVLARMALVSMTAVQVGPARPRDTVAVLGLGLVGNLAAQLYRLQGARVVVYDPVAGRRRLAARCGLEVLDVGEQDVVEAIVDATNGTGARITVDAAGLGPVVQQCVEATAAYGTVVLLGSPRPVYETNLTAVFNRIHMQWLTVRGALEWRLPPYPVPGGGPSVQENLQLILEHLAEDRLVTRDLISHLISPAKILDAYRGMLDDKESHHGVVLDWRNVD